MKRIVASFVCVVLFVAGLALTACEDKSSSTSTYINISAFEVGELRALRNTGHFADESAGSVDSYIAQDGAAFLVFNNYSSMQQNPLCESTTCLHNDSSCDAYVSSDDPIQFIFVTNSNVILQRQNGDNFERNSFTLEIMDFDGGNRSMLVDIPGKLMSFGQYITDDNALFLQTINGGKEAITLGETSMEPGESALLRIDLASGEISKLLNLNDYLLIGVDGDDFLLWHDVGDEHMMVAYSAQEGNGRELPIPSEEVQDHRSTSAYKGVMYYVSSDLKSASLIGYSPISGENVLEVVLPSKDAELSSIVGDYALFSYSTTTSSGTKTSSAHDSWVFVSLVSGEIIEPPYNVDYAGQNVPANITGTSEGDYIIVSGSLTYVYEKNGQEKTATQNVYTRISASDYWDGKESQDVITLWAPPPPEQAEEVVEDDQQEDTQVEP